MADLANITCPHGFEASSTASTAAEVGAVSQSQLAAVPGQLSAPDPTPWGPVAAVLLCLLPIALLLLVTLLRRLSLPSSTSLPLAAALLALIRLGYLSSPPLFVLASIVRGVLEALTPLSVIYGAILLFETMQHTKCLPWMMRRVKSLSAGQPLAEVFLIGWAFAFMISGVGGFNTPIALAAPMLASLGHDPVKSLLVVLLLNGLASHLGSVGMAVWFGFKTLGLGQANVLLVGLKSAILVGAVSFILGPLAASFLVTWSQLVRGSVFVMLSISSAVLPTVVVAGFSPEFPVLIGGLTAMICTTLCVYYRVGLGPETNTQDSDILLSNTLNRSSTYRQTSTAALANSSSNSRSSRSCAAAVWQSLRHVVTGLRPHGTISVNNSKVTDCITRHNMRLTAVPPAAGLPATAASVADSQLQAANEMIAVPDLEQGLATDNYAVPVELTSASSAVDDGAPDKRSHGPPGGIVLTSSSHIPLGSAADIHNLTNLQLATVSCPAACGHPWHRITHTWDDDVISGDDDADSDGVVTPDEGWRGCEGLWEDHHSAMLVALPASLVAATIHHAALSGVSRMPGFAGAGGGHTAAAAAAAGGARQQHQRQQQQHVQEASEGNSSSGVSSSEIQVAAAAAVGPGLRLFAQQMDEECGVLHADIEPTAQPPITAAAAAAVVKSPGFSGFLQKQQQQQHLWTECGRKQQYIHDGRLQALSRLCVVLQRTLPIWLIVLLLLLTRIPVLRIQAMLQSTSPSFSVHLGTLGTFSLSAALVVQLQQLFTLHDVNWSYQLLYVPCLLPFVAASVVTMIVHRHELKKQQLTWKVPFQHAWQKMQGTFSVLIGAMVLSELISAGGAAVDSPAYIIGYYLSHWLGRGYLGIAGLLGALGSFVSGSVMAGNMTFGAIQKVAAEHIGVSVTGMLAVQTSGSCAGKMMCISNILSAKVMLDLQGMREGRIIRRTAPAALMFVLMTQAIGLAFTLGDAWPDKPMMS